MYKFFKIFFKMFLVAMIIYCLYLIIFVIVSWDYEPDDQIINNPIIMSGIETIILGSEKELPPAEDLLEKDEKAKVFITLGEDALENDVLKIWLFNSNVSKDFLCQEIRVRPTEHLRRRSWLSFIGPYDFYIKSISLRENLLEIKLGVSKGFDIFAMVLVGFWAGAMVLLLISLTKKKKK